MDLQDTNFVPLICSGSIVGVVSFNLSLIVVILLLKNRRKSSQLRVAGIEGSTVLWLLVSLATVLKRNLELFLLTSIKFE